MCLLHTDGWLTIIDGQADSPLTDSFSLQWNYVLILLFKYISSASLAHFSFLTVSYDITFYTKSLGTQTNTKGG